MRVILDTDMRSLIAFDPGGTTGWCRFEKQALSQAYIPRWHLTEFGQFPTDLIRQVDELIQPFDVVVFERIQVMHMGFDPIGLEIIGAIKLVCQLNGNKCIGQSPGNINGPKLWPDLMPLRKLFKNQQHAKDAFYHGVFYIGLAHLDLKSPLEST